MNFTVNVPFPHPQPLAPYVCGWMQMIITIPVETHQQSGAKKRKKRWSLCITFRYIHNPVKLFWLLTLIMCFNVSNNLTPNNASNILSFHVPLRKLAMVLTQIKPKIMVPVSHGDHKWSMVLLLQIGLIVYKEVLGLYIYIYIYIYIYSALQMYSYPFIIFTLYVAALC